MRIRVVMVPRWNVLSCVVSGLRVGLHAWVVIFFFLNLLEACFFEWFIVLVPNKKRKIWW